VALLAVGALALPATAAESSDKNAGREAGREAKAQLGFGVDMARRGLWQEALFRFEQVRKLRPDDPKALNNLAVAYEALGRFDDAEPLYLEAERLAPSNRDIKKNHARFKEFLNQFRAKKPAQVPEEKKEGTP
jgi:Flp pilus assembly protein TadD